ncbi:c-type cytochrome biogenesis protein CcmI [Pacificispira sp.]|uniref:c-type cytochrome biogenesis protein CcmI n=1 Tax=Pacificispira sp. TaxID=2888761 RepID=UPI003BAA2735
MIFWVFAALATVAAGYAVLRPLLREAPGAEEPDVADYDVTVYKSQLHEVARDLDRGRITAEEAEASRVEIGRRLLAADRRRQSAVRERRSGTGSQAVAAALIAGALTLTVLLYLDQGDPANPDMPLALRQAERQLAQNAGGAGSQPVAGEDGEAGNLDDMAAQLTARLAAGDGAPADWSLLGRTEMMRGNYAQAAAAYEEALKSFPDDAALNSAYGEALVFWSNGDVSDTAAATFHKVLSLTLDDPRAHFYLGAYDRQEGRLKDALTRWVALLNRAGPDATWAGVVRQRAEELAADMGVDLEEMLLAGAAAAPSLADTVARNSGGPTAEDMAAAANMTEAERQDMIQGMVDGLAARLADDPSDFDGWLRLIRSRMVLDDRDGAQAALDTAAAQFAAAPFPMRQLTALAQELGLDTPAPATASTRGPSQEDVAAAQDMTAEERREMIEGMVGGLAARLEENPDDLQGWIMLGRSYTVLGRLDDADAALARASDLAPNNPEILIDRARILRAQAGEQQTPESVALMRRVEKIAPGNIEALWFLGLDAYRGGNRDVARSYFERALTALPPESPERASLEAEINRLFAEPVGN